MSIWESAGSFISNNQGTIGAGLGALAGGILANNSSNNPNNVTPFQTGISSSGSSSTSTSGAPGYILPFLTGDQGAYGQAQDIFNQNLGQGYQGLSPGQLTTNSQMIQGAEGFGLPYLDKMRGQSQTFADRYNTPGSALASMTDARGQQGALDPTQSLQQILSGQVDTRGLDALQQAATNRAAVGYGDRVQDLTDNYNQNIRPQIRDSALLSGQFGGSRQNVAEGIAAGKLNEQLARNARDLSLGSMDVGSKLYGDAYNQANQQRFGAATGLNTQAQQNAQFGANFGLASSAQNAGMEQAGVGMEVDALQNFLGAKDAAFNMIGRPAADSQNAQQFKWNQINNYLNLLHGATPQNTTSSSSGGSSQSWTPIKGSGPSTLQGAAYGGALGQGIGNLFTK